MSKQARQATPSSINQIRAKDTKRFGKLRPGALRHGVQAEVLSGSIEGKSYIRIFGAAIRYSANYVREVNKLVPPVGQTPDASQHYYSPKRGQNSLGGADLDHVLQLFSTIRLQVTMDILNSWSPDIIASVLVWAGALNEGRSQAECDTIRPAVIRMAVDAAFDKTFKVGEMAEYGSYNLHYYGPIVSVSTKTVVIAERHANTGTAPKRHRLDLNEFIWRNDAFVLSEVQAMNAETSMYI